MTTGLTPQQRNICRFIVQYQEERGYSPSRAEIADYVNLHPSTVIDKGLKKTDLCEKVGLSLGTIAKFSKGETVDGKIIARLCKYFDCQPGDIMEYVKDPPEDK